MRISPEPTRTVCGYGKPELGQPRTACGVRQSVLLIGDRIHCDKSTVCRIPKSSLDPSALTFSGNYSFPFLNRIYTSEIIPESFFHTKLTKLYKRKGDVSHIKSYRFIHNKCWGAKLLEKCVVKIMTDQINLHTPPNQLGGMPMHSTRDHIIRSHHGCESFGGLVLDGPVHNTRGHSLPSPHDGRV